VPRIVRLHTATSDGLDNCPGFFDVYLKVRAQNSLQAQAEADE